MTASLDFPREACLLEKAVQALHEPMQSLKKLPDVDRFESFP